MKKLVDYNENEGNKSSSPTLSEKELLQKKLEKRLSNRPKEEDLKLKNILKCIIINCS